MTIDGNVQYWDVQKEIKGLALSRNNTVAIVDQAEYSKTARVIVDDGHITKFFEYAADIYSANLQFVQETLCIMEKKQFGVVCDSGIKWLSTVKTHPNSANGNYFADQEGKVALIGYERLALWDLHAEKETMFRFFPEDERQAVNDVFLYDVNQLAVLKSRTYRKNNVLERYDLRQSLKPVQVLVGGNNRDLYTAVLLQSDNLPLLATRTVKEAKTIFINLNTFQEETIEPVHYPEGNTMFCGYETALVSDNQTHLAEVTHVSTSIGLCKSIYKNSMRVRDLTFWSDQDKGAYTLTTAPETIDLGTEFNHPTVAINKNHILYDKDDRVHLKEMI